MLAKSLATEWGPRGIRVNSLSPGYMRTDLIKGLLENEGKELVHSWEKDIPLGRMAEPHELRGTIVWMASESTHQSLARSFGTPTLTVTQVQQAHTSMGRTW
jgi:NAD(P)-dependent dehydrogenase (short-subunit alcohol dehydrogenase family)